MGAVGFVAKAGVARRAVAGIVLAALLALAGGAVLTAWAAARRTDSAYARLLGATHHADVVVAAQGDPSLFDPSIAADGPGVVSSGLVNGYGGVELLPDGTVDLSAQFALVVPVDTTAFYEIDRPLLVQGRLPDPDTPDEVVIDQHTRDAGHPVGSTLDTCVFNFVEAGEFVSGLPAGPPTPPQLRAFVEDVCAVHQLRVVGVERPGPDNVVLRADSEGQVFIVGSPAFVATAGTAKGFSFALVDLAPGADVNRYVDVVLDRSSPDAGVSLQAASLRATVVSRTIEPFVRALSLFAAITAVLAAGVLGPAIVRWAATPETDRAPLVAAGLRTSQLRLASALRGAVVGGAAAIGAVAIAIAASGRFPVGVAARIEPHPGLRLDVPVLLVGVIALVALPALLGAVASTTALSPSRRQSRIADGLQASGVAPSIVAGVRSALSRDGRGATVVPTAMGVAIAIAAVVAALTYQAGLGRLLETPARYGWTWDLDVDSYGNGLAPEIVDGLREAPMVTALAVGHRSVLVRDGTSVPTFAFDSERGSINPTIVEGRAPRGDSEVALGGQTLDRLDIAIGDHVTFRGPSGDVVETSIVGRTLLPLVDPADDLSIAEGALVDAPLLDRLGGDVSLALVDLAPGATADDLREVLQSRGVSGADSAIVGPDYTADLRGYDAVRNTPLLLAGLLALLGLGVLAHTIIATARRRQRELAVLRCLGFVGRDVRASVRWNALTVVGMCLVVSVPIGIGLGRTLWSTFADGIGVVNDAVTPALQVVDVIGATIVGAVVLAAIPGRRVSRVRPADVLRSE